MSLASPARLGRHMGTARSRSALLRTADGGHVLRGLDAERGAQVPEGQRAVVLPAEVAAGVRRRLARAVAREGLLELRAPQSKRRQFRHTSPKPRGYPGAAGRPLFFATTPSPAYNISRACL